MANIDHILQAAGAQMADLAKSLFNQYRNQAIADGKALLAQTKAQLTLWVNALELKEMDKDEFASLVRGKKDDAEMHALKQAGLSDVAIDKFVNGVMNIVIDSAFAAVGVK